MQNNPDALRGEVRLLWESGEVFGLEPEDLAPYVGVPADRVYEWFGGGQTPSDEEKAKILAGVDAIDRDHPIEFETLPSGAQVSAASWGDPSLDDKNPEILAEREFDDKIRPVFASLMAAARDTERPIIAKGWPDFVELLGLARKYRVRIPQ